MAQMKKSVSFKNAIIDMNDRTITEITKDDTKVYKLDSILNEWNKMGGLTFTIQQSEDIPSIDEAEDYPESEE